MKGLWTALHLRRLGARVTVVDAYGAGNSRQTSGGETRGVRTSYGDRPHGRQWAGWARRAIERWVAWDEEGRDRLLPRLFFQTGDLILRDEVNRYITETRGNWDALGTPYEVLAPAEVAYRWPWMRYDDLGVALYEPAAGVVRARRAIESVARVFEDEGGALVVGRASFGARVPRPHRRPSARGPRSVGPLDRAGVPRPASRDPQAAFSGSDRGPDQRNARVPLRDERRRELHRRHPPGPRQRLDRRRRLGRGVQVRAGAR